MLNQTNSTNNSTTMMGSCVSCSIEYCKTCSGNNVCQECQMGYVLNSNGSSCTASFCKLPCI